VRSHLRVHLSIGCPRYSETYQDSYGYERIEIPKREGMFSGDFCWQNECPKYQDDNRKPGKIRCPYRNALPHVTTSVNRLPQAHSRIPQTQSQGKLYIHHRVCQSGSSIYRRDNGSPCRRVSGINTGRTTTPENDKSQDQAKTGC